MRSGGSQEGNGLTVLAAAMLVGCAMPAAALGGPLGPPSGRDSSGDEHANWETSVRYDDIAGRDLENALRELAKRGFVEVDRYTVDGKAYRVLFRKESRQCVQVAIGDGMAAALIDLEQDPKCI